MDSGEVIPGLNEDWSFAGAKAMEWCAGLVMFCMVGSLFDKIGAVMPLLILVMIGTTLSLAGLRKSFPDEERGVRNHFMLMCGFEPPGIPTPAVLQPFWSGAPVRGLRDECPLVQLGLDIVLEQVQREHAPQGEAWQ